MQNFRFFDENHDLFTTQVWHGVQYEEKPTTGESLNFDIRNCQRIEELAKKPESGIRAYAYNCHYKDRRTQAYYDYLKARGITPEWNPGDKVNTHWNVVLFVNEKFDRDLFCKAINMPWFLLKPVEIKRKKELGMRYETDVQAFIDCLRYLTHEDDTQGGVAEKVEYKKEDVHSNFDYEGFAWRDDYGLYYK